MYSKISINGVVQGIGFRPFIYNLAIKHQLTGFVHNKGDAGVEIQIKGTEKQIKAFIEDLKTKKPALALYEEFSVDLDTTSIKKTNFKTFRISESNLTKGKSGSYIPPDLPICEKCLVEIYTDPRRKYYPFTSCVDCGPRYSVITSLPYDRPRTIMNVFPFCQSCLKEYKEPSDRRFHAQTTCCWECGPKYEIYDKQGKIAVSSQEFRSNWDLPSRLLNEGKVLAVKGIGGTHIASSTTQTDVILKIRNWKGARGDKPFAVMTHDKHKLAEFASFNKTEEKLLNSIARPIVLLNKKMPFPLSEMVSPDLHNIGVLFPYAGIHYSLLENINDPAIIMTSGNPTNMPILIENTAIIKDLASLVDYYLLHDREIYQRIDDSVLRVHKFNGNSFPVLIRRSRGFVPEPIKIPWIKNQNAVIALGAEMHSVGAIGVGSKIFPSQHIGHLSTLENTDFFTESLNHLKGLLGVSKVDAYGGDLHPQMTSTALGKDFAEKYEVPFYQFQHHHAHLSALAIDAGINPEEEIICVALDGTGYGTDGTIWGGEILIGNYNYFKRIGHLEHLFLPGGDLAVKSPHRGLLAVLLSKYSIEEITSDLQEMDWLRWIIYSKDYDLLMKTISSQQKQSNLPKYNYTSSCGRFLDIISILLGVTRFRSYEGEPAIKLESFSLHKSNDRVEKITKMESKKNSNGRIEIKTVNYILDIWELVKSQNCNRKHIGYVVQKVLAKKLAEVAIETSNEYKINKIGLSGGVGYNQAIFSEFYKQIPLLSKNCEPIYHKSIPCGDGGVSIGQIPLILARSKYN
ncbi:MAG: carbamoyltransferase HypF [Candidatus Hodarchaeales archaeon]